MYKGFAQEFAAAQQAAPSQTAQAGKNHALLFERFCSINQSHQPDATQKLAWLAEFEGPCGDPALLQAHLAQRKHFAEQSGATLCYFETEWRIVSGTGNPHPVENGLSWHPVLCVPYLAASSIKGLARAFATHWQGWQKDEIERIFGTQQQAGAIEFYDLVPHRPLKLMVDVMTPHLGDWYAKGGSQTTMQGPNAGEPDFQKTPAPWHNPVPIAFLVMEQAHFFTLLRATKRAQADDVAKVEALLHDALCVAGAGAKTATGYGRLQRDDKQFEKDAEQLQAQQQAQQEQQRKAADAAIKKMAEEEKARLQARPNEEKIAQLLATLRAKADKETASWLIGKKFDAWVKEQNVGIEEVKAALWQDAVLLARLRSWSGKKGDEAQAWQRFAPPKKK